MNKRRLGDIANDGLVYGSKIYLFINESNTIEIVDKKSLKSIKQVSLVDSEGLPYSPRNGIGYNSNVWFTCFKGVVLVLDTITFELKHEIKVGKNPEGIVVLRDKIFVTNSGGLDYPNYDSTLSIIDPIDFKEIKKITVGLNPGSILTNGSLLYVNCRGNYGTIKSKIVVLNEDAVFQENLPINPTLSSIYNNKLIGVNSSTDGGAVSSFIIYDLATNSILIQKPLTGVITPSFVQWIDDTHFWIGDANSYQSSGYVSKYETTGKLVHKYATGMIPNECLFIN